MAYSVSCCSRYTLPTLQPAIISSQDETTVISLSFRWCLRGKRMNVVSLCQVDSCLVRRLKAARVPLLASPRYKSCAARACSSPTPLVPSPPYWSSGRVSLHPPSALPWIKGRGRQRQRLRQLGACLRLPPAASAATDGLSAKQAAEAASTGNSKLCAY